MDTSVVIILIGSSSAITALALKLCYMSRCVKIKLCCGLCDIDRVVTNEQVINLDNNQTPTRSTTI